MKKILTIITVACLATVLIFATSCKKEQKDKKTSGTTSITISGYAYFNAANSSNLGYTKPQYVPNGTKIIFSLNTKDLAIEPVKDYVYPTKIYTTEVQDGKYSLTIDTSSKQEGITYKYYCQNFEIGINDHNNKKCLVSFEPKTLVVYQGQDIKKDIVFDGLISSVEPTHH